ncbi:hypothetical protein ACQ2H7_000488 [Candidozyma auris]
MSQEQVLLELEMILATVRSIDESVLQSIRLLEKGVPSASYKELVASNKARLERVMALLNEITLTSSLMDNKQKQAVEKYSRQKVRETQQGGAVDDEGSEEDLDLMLEELEKDYDESSAKYREQRLEELKKEFGKIDRAAAERGSELGNVSFVSAEKELMDLVMKSEVCMVHFYQPEFSRCKLMNERLAVLAEKHVDVGIFAIQASQAPFLVTKLKIKVLPVVVAYKNGKEVARLVGFEGLSTNGTDFSVEALESWMFRERVISKRSLTFASKPGTVITSNNNTNSDDDDDDWY